MLDDLDLFRLLVCLLECLVTCLILKILIAGNIRYDTTCRSHFVLMFPLRSKLFVYTPVSVTLEGRDTILEAILPIYIFFL